MSIALEAKVTALEQRVAELVYELISERDAHVIFEGKVLFRLEELERARKPGPKPKDSNG